MPTILSHSQHKAVHDFRSWPHFPRVHDWQPWQRKAAHDLQSWAQWRCKSRRSRTRSYGVAGRLWSPETACHQVRFRIQPRNPLLWLSTRGSAFFGLRCLRSQAIISRLLGLVESRRNSNEKGAHLECGHLSSSSATSRDCREVLWSWLNTGTVRLFIFRGFLSSEFFAKSILAENSRKADGHRAVTPSFGLVYRFGSRALCIRSPGTRYRYLHFAHFVRFAHFAHFAHYAHYAISTQFFLC